MKSAADSLPRHGKHHVQQKIEPPLPKSGEADLAGAVVFLWLLPVLTLLGVAWKVFELPLPACVFHGISGFPCPTCGMSRGFSLLLQGDVVGAVQINPLTIGFPVLLALMWSFFFLRVMRWLPITWKNGLPVRVSLFLRVGIVVVLAGVWGYLLSRGMGGEASL